MADKIRVGIVGATVTQGGSGWGANAHVPAIEHLPDYELKAVCTADETAQASKEKFGAALAFTDINEMAAHPEVDLVAVCVRVPGHYEPGDGRSERQQACLLRVAPRAPTSKRPRR